MADAERFVGQCARSMTDHAHRETLLDREADTSAAMLHAAEWSGLLAEMACQSGCHMAAIHRLTRADAAWRAASEELDDFDSGAEVVEFHHGLVNRLSMAWAGSAYPTDAQIQASLDRMDRLFGEGWLEEGA